MRVRTQPVEINCTQYSDYGLSQLLGINLGRRQGGRAMRAAGCFDRNGRETEWAVPHNRNGCLLFAFQAIHLADKHEYHEGNNQKVGEDVEEDPVIDRGGTRSFRLRKRGIGMPRKVDEFV